MNAKKMNVQILKLDDEDLECFIQEFYFIHCVQGEGCLFLKNAKDCWLNWDRFTRNGFESVIASPLEFIEFVRKYSVEFDNKYFLFICGSGVTEIEVYDSLEDFKDKKLRCDEYSIGWEIVQTMEDYEGECEELYELLRKYGISVYCQSNRGTNLAAI